MELNLHEPGLLKKASRRVDAYEVDVVLLVGISRKYTNRQRQRKSKVKECVKVDVALVCAVKRHHLQPLKAGIKTQIKSDVEKRKKKKIKKTEGGGCI